MIAYLVRHAESRPSADVPDADWPLSARGREQARRLAEVLADLGIEEVHCSPYLRCRETIAPFVAAAGLPLREHRDLRERRLAPGLIDDFAEHWRRSWEDFHYALPGCESAHAAQQRVHAAVLAICARSAARVLAISSHGNALALLLHRLDPRFHVERAAAMRNPELYRVIHRAGELRWDEGFRAPALDAFATSTGRPGTSRG
jgi:2,3-bisphosphoglycerate-dependent phosphoglycerate mutase